MPATLVHVYVKPEYIDAFILATKDNHENSIRENGNLRFDILQDANDSSKFVLYEVYDHSDAVKMHKETPHYILWRDTVAPMMAKPREGYLHTLLFPQP